MHLGIFIFLLLAGGSLALVGSTWAMALRLVPASERTQTLIWLRSWSLKGLVFPFLVWALINIGLSWWLEAFMPSVQAAQNGGKPWLPVYFRVVGAGWFVTASYWTALSLLWLIFTLAARIPKESSSDFRSLCLTSCLGMLLFAVLILVFAGWYGAGMAVVALVAPIVGYTPELLHQKKQAPAYSRAIAKMKFGKYTEAEWEIIRQLENHEDDFQGWMMMAELYAEHFHDLHEAEQTVMEICDQPSTTQSQMSVALHKLADWQLKLADDPLAARRALQIICDRCRGSHLAHMAQLRIKQLPPTSAELRRQRSAAPIPLPALGDQLENEAPGPPPMVRREAIASANACVAMLEEDPNNVDVRERLARLLAEQLGQAAQAIEQLRMLLDMPEQPEPRQAEWLALIAAWELRYRQDAVAARKVLEQIVTSFPKTPQCLAAKRRLELMSRAEGDPSKGAH